MNVRLRNADHEPYELELDLPEAREGYPLLSFRRYADALLGLSLKPGPFLELVLAENNVALKRGSGRTRPGQEEVLVSTAVTRGAGGPVAAPSQKPGKPGLMGRLFGGGKPAGMSVRVRTAGSQQYVFETALAAGRYEGGAFEGPMLHLHQQRSGMLGMESAIATLSIRPGPVLEVFLINGTAFWVDAKDSERTVMSTERAVSR